MTDEVIEFTECVVDDATRLATEVCGRPEINRIVQDEDELCALHGAIQEVVAAYLAGRRMVLILRHVRSWTALTHGGDVRVREFELLLNGVVIEKFSDRSSRMYYRRDELLDEYISGRLALYEQALGVEHTRENA